MIDLGEDEPQLGIAPVLFSPIGGTVMVSVFVSCWESHRRGLKGRMRMRSRLLCFAASLAVVVGLAPGSGAAQTFTGATEVTVVEVPVQVVKDGEPVRGLTANDFEIYDGRKKVPVTGFEVLDLAGAPGGARTEAQIPASARRHFLMLFDLSFSEPSALARARDAAKDVVKTLHPTDLVPVATYSSIR